MTGVAALGAFLLAMSSAAVMGFAITRGATCMVAAVDETIRQRRFTRTLALVEAALWVAAGLSLAALVGLMPRPVGQHAIGSATILGGALLGIGASVNRACVFGSIARLGAGEWVYLLTPLGFLTGCVAVQSWLPFFKKAEPAMTTFPTYPSALLLILLVFALWRGWGFIKAARARMLSNHLWSPHLATSVIGVTFVILALVAGAWTYPEALAELSRGMGMNSAARFLFFLALLGGAILGGVGRGGPKRRWSLAAALRCVAGGALMGMGSLLIPGGNDNLILAGLPFLLPYAWVAIGTMTVAICAALLAEDRFNRALAQRSVEH